MRQLGLLWGLVAVLLVVMAPLAPRLVTALPICPVRAVFDLPCPSCGTSRAALALSRFDLPGSIAANPLAALAWVILVVGGLIAGMLALAGIPLRERRWRLSLRSRAALVAIVLANWLYLLGAG